MAGYTPTADGLPVRKQSPIQIVTWPIVN